MLGKIRQNWLGVLGLLVLCVAIAGDFSGRPRDAIDFIGVTMMTLYAFQQRNEFFCYLQTVAELGVILRIVHASNNILMIVLGSVSLFALIMIFRKPVFREFGSLIGVAGLLGLAYGYATLNIIGFTVGGIGLMIYGFIGFKKGFESALLFAILNGVYSVAALYVLFKTYPIINIFV